MQEHDILNQENDRSSLRGKLYHILREDILSGKFHDHEELRENTIAKEYGVSRTPVREAIRQLELEGLVAVVPNKGAYVKGIDKKDVDDIYAIRALLEGLCARWAAQNITGKQLEDLEEILYMVEFHLKHERYEQVFELDGKFHDTLYEASHSEMLKHLLKDFHDYVQRARKFALKEGTRARKSYEEHLAIVEAIKAHDADEAARLAQQHIQNTVENFVAVDISKAIEADEGGQ